MLYKEFLEEQFAVPDQCYVKYCYQVLVSANPDIFGASAARIKTRREALKSGGETSGVHMLRHVHGCTDYSFNYAVFSSLQIKVHGNYAVQMIELCFARIVFCYGNIT